MNYYIQIGDLFMYHGEPISELLEDMDSSELPYSINENPEKLVAKDGLLTVQLDSKEWFWISYIKNNTIKESFINLVGTPDLCLPYTYILDGSSYRDVMGMTKDEVTELIVKAFPDHNRNEILFDISEIDWDENNLMLQYTATFWDTPNSKPGNIFTMSYRFWINKEENKVVGEMDDWSSIGGTRSAWESVY